MADDLRVVIDADAEPLRRELTSAGGAVRIFGREVDSQSRSGRAFSAAIDKQKDSLHGLASVAKTAGIGIAGGLAIAAASAIKTGAAFESQMARVKAVTGATEQQMGQLRQLAIKLGADTKFSAGEAAEGMYELASAGFNVKETAAALPGVLNLAAASNVGLAEAAEINSNALRGFGLASSESTHVADVLTQAVNSSSVEMTDLQATLKYIGPVAHATGESFESMIGAVALLGDAGIKGEQAGTTLRAGLLQLVKPTKTVEEGLGSLGLTAKDLQGPNGLLPLPQIVAKLQSGMGGLSKAQQIAAVTSIFGREAFSGMIKVVEAGPEKLRALTGEFEHSSGASAKAAKTMNDTVKGSFEELKGSFETVEIELFEHFAPQLKGALKEATQFVNEEGTKLQNALDKAMATPEFKQGDFGKKAEIILGAFGDVWGESGLGDDIREGLVEAFNFALPRVADAIGKGAVISAETFVKGFIEASPMGKLAIGAWLFTKLGGVAALRAAGARAGTEVAAGMATTIEAGAATAAGTSAAAGAAASGEKQLLIANSSGAVTGTVTAGASAAEGAAAAGIVSKTKGLLSKGLASAGAVAGGYFAAEFGAKAVEGLTGADLLENQSLMTSLSHGFNTKGVLKVEVDALQRNQGLNSDKSQAELVSLEKHFAQTMRKIRTDAAVGLGGINKALDTGLAQANETWIHGSAPWRQHVVEAMRAAVAEIKQGMEAGTISASEGQKAISKLLEKIHPTTGKDPFGLAKAAAETFQQTGKITAGGVADWTKQLQKMPKAARESSREAMAGMLAAWAQGHPKLEAQVDNLTRYQITKFGGANRQLEASTAAAMSSIAASSAEGATNTGAALSNVFDNLRNALAAVGSSKIPTFSATVLSAASQYHHAREEKSGLGRQDGGIVPGSGDGDTVPDVVPAGTFIMNREATRAFGFQRGGNVPVVLEPGEAKIHPRDVARIGRHNLEAMNAAVPRFQAGGTASAGGVNFPHPGLVGPEPERSLGQGAIDKGWKAADKYLLAHLEPQRVLAMLHAGEAISSKGFPYVYGGGHGSFGIQPVDCSGLVSYVLHAGGFLDTPMSVQQGSGLYTLGAPGPGKYFTWGVRGSSGENAHTMISVKKPGTQGWGFFESGGSGGGAHEDQGWDGAFSYRHMPGFQKGGSVGATGTDGAAVSIPKNTPAAARKTISKYGAEALRPGSPHFVGWGFQGGGMVPQMLAAGGQVIKGKVSYFGGGATAGGKDTSQPGIAVNLHPGTESGWDNSTTQGWMDQSKAGHPIVAAVQITGHKANLPIIDLGPAGFTQRAIDVTEGGVSALGFSTSNFPTDAVGTATVGTAHENAKEEKEHTNKEEVPALYLGCHTDALSLSGGMPNSIEGVEKELRQRRAEVTKYSHAVKAAQKHDRPAVAEALQHNITALQTRIAELTRERTKQRRDKAKRHFTARLAKSLGSVTGMETAIEAAQHVYETRSESASHLVDEEPTQTDPAPAPKKPPYPPHPQLPASATKAEREAARKAYEKQQHAEDRAFEEQQLAYEQQRLGSERTYVHRFANYVSHKERPAYGGVLASENHWRNLILGAEEKAAGDWQKLPSPGGLQGGYEQKITGLMVQENVLEDFAARVAREIAHWRSDPDNKGKELPDALKKAASARKAALEKVPLLNFQEKEVRKVLGEARGAFYPGHGRIVDDPPPPAIGSGTFETNLAEVQGSHFPGQHERMKALPSTHTGLFGGVIWDTQEAIEGLGLKISEAIAGVNEETGSLAEEEWPEEEGAAEGPDTTAWTAAKEAISQQAIENLALSQGETRTIAGFLSDLGSGIPYLGAFMTGTGGLGVARSGLAMLHRGEEVVPDSKGPAGSQFGAMPAAAHHDITLVLNDRAGHLVELVDARVDGKMAKVNQRLGAEARRRGTAPGRV